MTIIIGRLSWLSKGVRKMKIGQMFVKPIDRDLKGVIKVGQDDDRNIQQELEEYVVTRELQKLSFL